MLPEVEKVNFSSDLIKKILLLLRWFPTLFSTKLIDLSFHFLLYKMGMTLSLRVVERIQ